MDLDSTKTYTATIELTSTGAESQTTINITFDPSIEEKVEGQVPASFETASHILEWLFATNMIDTSPAYMDGIEPVESAEEPLIGEVIQFPRKPN
jgi:hypothetical protein